MFVFKLNLWLHLSKTLLLYLIRLSSFLKPVMLREQLITQRLHDGWHLNRAAKNQRKMWHLSSPSPLPALQHLWSKPSMETINLQLIGWRATLTHQDFQTNWEVIPLVFSCQTGYSWNCLSQQARDASHRLMD